MARYRAALPGSPAADYEPRPVEPKASSTCSDRDCSGDAIESEEWRPVVSMEGDYEVSSAGRIRNAKTLRVLSPSRAGRRRAYLQVNLSRGRRKYIHHAVLEAFAGPRPGDPYLYHAAHLDGDSFNNTCGNLAWVTRWENEQHKRLHGTDPSGERNPRAKLTAEGVAEIRAQVAEWMDRYEITPATIFAVAKEYRWTAR